MQRRLFKLVLTSVAVAATLFNDVATAQGGLFDWLFPRRQTTTRQYYMIPSGTALPYTANYGFAGAQPTFVQPAAVQPVASQPYTTNYWGTIQPYAWYAPQNQYRTMWRPVPVTTFMPAGTNSLIPSAGYTWEANRIPVVAFQPTIPASVAPTVAATPTCPMGGTGATAPTTAFYGGMSAWSPTMTTATEFSSSSAATEWTPVTDAPTAGLEASAASDYSTMYTPTEYAPSSSLTPWQRLEQSATGTTTPWQPVEEATTSSTLPSASTSPYPEVTTERNGNGHATPWAPVPGDEAQSHEGTTEADLSPSITHQRPAPTNTASSADNPWRAYDPQEPTNAGRTGPADARAATYPSGSNASEQQLVPFLRPIPDADRAGKDWDFDDKMRLRPREPRSARNARRWQAVPVGGTQVPAVNQASQRPVLDAPNARDEGGWRSVPQ